ncbi:PREDICTED: mitochondrial inner membrane protein OXA1-like isoform X1 [Camelina sativa]|uniref:Mitochondrial inner membrane protein OXA1-like isoform X1 n=1 Tax=Camelina sativa TaxID=90675 RepID=A0ABM1RAK6_CAMSA|nr:PREDICTED: mitochondrial inner membrane protein OXA1-like isoform X1 [Camelina sativa]
MATEALMKPRLESIQEEMQNKGMDSVTMAEGNKKMKNFFKDLQIWCHSNERDAYSGSSVPLLFSCYSKYGRAFQTGGALWFTDLTTPDSLYILPVITGLTFLITVE